MTSATQNWLEKLGYTAEPAVLHLRGEAVPETHPYALEIILKALAAIPDAQVFLATHSPLVVQQAGVDSLLCFTRNERAGVQIIHGLSHPALKNWRGSPDLAAIFESRVLG